MSNSLTILKLVLFKMHNGWYIILLFTLLGCGSYSQKNRYSEKYIKNLQENIKYYYLLNDLIIDQKGLYKFLDEHLDYNLQDSLNVIKLGKKNYKVCLSNCDSNYKEINFNDVDFEEPFEKYEETKIVYKYLRNNVDGEIIKKDNELGDSYSLMDNSCLIRNLHNLDYTYSVSLDVNCKKDLQKLKNHYLKIKDDYISSNDFDFGSVKRVVKVTEKGAIFVDGFKTINCEEKMLNEIFENYKQAIGLHGEELYVVVELSPNW